MRATRNFRGTSTTSRSLPYLDGSEVTITAHVVHDGVVRVLGGDRRQIVEIETEEIAPAEPADLDPSVAQAPPRVLQAGMRLTIYSRDESEMTARPTPPLTTSSLTASG